MFFKLFLLFTVVPVLELSLLIKIGSLIGAMNTIMIVLITAVAGAYLVRMEGLGVMTRFQSSMAQGAFPAEEILDGALILIAGALLVTPGVLTDIIGFSLVFPLSRAVIKRFIKIYIEKKISGAQIHINRY